jgi:hypothetical protein
VTQETLNIMLSSGMAAIIATTIYQPFDYMKTRHLAGHKPVYNWAFFKTLNKGLKINLLRVVPHFMITMSCTEYFKKCLF